MEAKQPTARVVGAGIAGIASAIRWARKGYEVHVHEANRYPGGKLSQFQLGAPLVIAQFADANLL